MIEQTLQKIGLSDKEIKVYMTSLRLGPAPVRRIAEEADINRGTTYDVLRSLIDAGLASYYHKDKKQYFIAEDPSKLKETVEQKKSQLDQMKKEIDDIIPQLRSMHNNTESKPVVKMYDGYTGIKTVLQDVIESCEKGDKEYYVYSSATIKNFLYNVYPNFSKDRIAADIKVKVISIGPGGETRGLDERKWLTSEDSSPTYTLIYEGKVAMISVDENQKPMGVIIEDVNIYQTQKMLFEFTWSKL